MTSSVDDDDTGQLKSAKLACMYDGCGESCVCVCLCVYNSVRLYLLGYAIMHFL